jgi:hypothetical protein
MYQIGLIFSAFDIKPQMHHINEKRNPERRKEEKTWDKGR